MQGKQKKVGILTFHYSTNPGSLLQAYALKSRLEQESALVDIINYSNKKQTDSHLLKQYKRKYAHLAVLRFWTNKLKNIARDFNTERQCNAFRKKYLGIGNGAKRYDDGNIAGLESAYDRFVVGSDQIWNIRNMRFSYSYLLDFVPEKEKKLSYAPSLSADVDLTAEERKKYAEALQGFAKLSSREKAGSEFIRDLTGRDCETVLDPTLLFDGAFWKKLIDGKKPVSDSYLFTYLRSNDPAIRAEVNRLMDDGHKVFIAPGREYTKGIRNMVVDIAPEEWLSLIFHSQCIITNSFHGVVFSVLFGKDFWVKTIQNAKTNARIQNLLSVLGLEDRLLKDGEAADLSAHIDYAPVWERLDILRERSNDYIRGFDLEN